ncbi:MAG: MATE family efflux transporter, partial [Myxococcota bacterium]
MSLQPRDGEGEAPAQGAAWERAHLAPQAPPPTGAGAPGVWELAWPVILGNLLYSTVGLVDIKIVGSLGPSAIAAVTTGNRMFFVLQAMLMAITAGTTALVARAWGAGDRTEAERVTRASVLLCLVLATVLMMPGLVFAEVLARFFRLEPETVALAATFIRWLSVFNVAFAVFFVLGVALRAAGDTRTPLWTGALTNVVNVVLVYSLVYGKLGLPALGVRGAAIASGIAFTTGAVVLMGLWISRRLVLGPGAGRALQRDRIRRLLHIGYPAALEQGAWQGGFLAFLWIVALYGTAPYAAYGIGVNILSFSFVVGFGFSIAASTLVGQRLGARDPEGATHSGWRATRLSVAAMVVLGGSIILAAERIAGFMIDDPEVVRLTVAFIYILGAVQPLMAIEFALGGALRGAGDTRFPLITVLTGLLGVRCVIAGVFAWLGLAVEWIFAALIGDYVVKATMLTTRFARGRWREI